jgi:integrase
VGKRGNGEGSIYQRASDGLYIAAYKGADGRRHTISGKARSQVNQRLVAAQRDAQQGRVPGPARLTVGVLLSQWLASVRPTIRYSTFRSYQEIVRLHLEPELGKTTLLTLSPAQVDALLRSKSDAGLSPRRVAYIRTVLRRALGQALRWGQVSRNVAALVDVPRQVRHEIAPLSPTECRTLLDHIRGDRLEALYVVALATGLRQGELFGLQWSDLDLAAGTLYVGRALVRTATGYGFAEPKTEASRRTINLPAVAVTALREHRARQVAERLRFGPAWDDGDLVFCTTIGTPLDSRNVTHAFQRHLVAAGIPRRRFHDLRYSAATLLMLQGVSPRVVQEMLGHSSVTVTLGTYSHVLPALKREAAERMDEVLKATS